MPMSCPVFMMTGIVLLWGGSRAAWKIEGGPKPPSLVLGEALLVIVALLLIGLILISTVRF